MILNDYYVILYAYDIPKYFKEYYHVENQYSNVTYNSTINQLLKWFNVCEYDSCQ